MCMCVLGVGVDRKEEGRDLKYRNLFRDNFRNPQVRVWKLWIRIEAVRMETKDT